MNDITAAEKNRVESSTLYLVATPIGNLDDITARALKVLSEVDFIAAEDTRVTSKLLSYYEIRRELVSYHEHNKAQVGDYIATRLASGESCALVTDAGTPGISDPGEDLVRLCAARDIRVVPIPGACAAINALIVSGLNTREFTFFGFVDTGNPKQRDGRLERIASCGTTAIVYEAPHRLCETLDLLYKTLGDRDIALCRELTKLNEDIDRTTLAKAIEYYAENKPRGEYVIVIEQKRESEVFWGDMDVREHFEYYTEKLGMDKKEATKQVARDRGLAKNEVYKALL